MFHHNLREGLSRILSDKDPNDKLWFIATNRGVIGLPIYYSRLKDALFHCHTYSVKELGFLNICVALEDPKGNLKVKAVFNSEECTKISYFHGVVIPGGRRVNFDHSNEGYFRANMVINNSVERIVATSEDSIHKTFVKWVQHWESLSEERKYSDRYVEITKVVDGKEVETRTASYREIGIMLTKNGIFAQ